jgi:hypothetical protein
MDNIGSHIHILQNVIVLHRVLVARVHRVVPRVHRAVHHHQVLAPPVVPHVGLGRLPLPHRHHVVRSVVKKDVNVIRVIIRTIGHIIRAINKNPV